MGGETRLIWNPDMERMSRVIVQEGVYRYSVVDDGGIQVRTVLFEYLATEVRWDF
jgi:hypothetical protein